METKVITHIYHYEIYHVTANYGILGKTAYSKKRIFSMPSNCQGLEYNSINVLLNQTYETNRYFLSKYYKSFCLATYY